MQTQITNLMVFIKNGTAVVPETVYDYHEYLKDVVERISGASKWLSPAKAGMGLSNAQKFDHSLENLKRLFPGAMQYEDVQKRVDRIKALKNRMLQQEDRFRHYLQIIIALRREYNDIQHRKLGYRSFTGMLRHKLADLSFNFRTYDRYLSSKNSNRKNSKKRSLRNWDKLGTNCRPGREIVVKDSLARIITQAANEELYYLLYKKYGKKLIYILLKGKLDTAPREIDPASCLLGPATITIRDLQQKNHLKTEEHVNFYDPYLIQELTILRQLARHMANLALTKNGMKGIFKDAYDVMQSICKQYTTELRIPDKIQMRLLRSMLDDPRALKNQEFAAEFRGAMDFDVYIAKERVLAQGGKVIEKIRYYPKGIEKIEPEKFKNMKPQRLTISQLKSAVDLTDIFWGPYRELWKSNLGIMHEAARGLLYAEMLDTMARNLWPKWKEEFEPIFADGQTAVNVHSPLSDIRDIFQKTMHALNGLKKIEVLLHIAINKMLDNGIFRHPHRLAYAHFTWKMAGRNLVREVLTKFGLGDLETHFHGYTSEQVLHGLRSGKFDMDVLKNFPNSSKNYQLLIDLMARKISPTEFRKRIDEISTNTIQLLASTRA